MQPTPAADGRDAPEIRPASPRGSDRWRDDVIALIPALRAFAWSLCHNRADADDLMQDTLTKAWSHRESFAPGTNLKAWLFTILRNTYYTTATRRRREVADVAGKHAATLVAPATQDWGLTLGALKQTLDQLPPDQRDALILVGAAGLTYEEAAEICGCAQGTIKSRVNRGRSRLMVLLEEGGLLEPSTLEGLKRRHGEASEPPN
jgi:RNA polymerase sigma-70 factor (ECF subfamily)